MKQHPILPSVENVEAANEEHRLRLSESDPSNGIDDPCSSNLAIVIPTINRADLLSGLLNKLAVQENDYRTIIIIDNGNQDIPMPCSRGFIIRNDSNLGVAASWNLGIDVALSDPAVEYVLVLNDDIELDCSQLRDITAEFAGNPDTWLFIGPFQWSVWAISRKGVDNIIRIDSHVIDDRFFPAYYEDTDFQRRFKARFPERIKENVSAFDPEVKRLRSSSVQGGGGPPYCREYYQTKWGGEPGREIRHPDEALSLEFCYRVICETRSDINEHLPALCALSQMCRHVTEFGTGRANSTFGILNGRPERFITYDRANPPPKVRLASDLASSVGVDFVFVKGDVLEVEIEETDMLFIDTFHAYTQLTDELRLHAQSVRKFIVFHDTVSFGYSDEALSGEILAKRGLIAAIVEFLETKEGKNWKHYGTNLANNGLTILVRSGSEEFDLASLMDRNLAPEYKHVLDPSRFVKEHGT